SATTRSRPGPGAGVLLAEMMACRNAETSAVIRPPPTRRVAPQLTVKGNGKPEREQFLDRPDMIGPSGGHGRRPLEPLLAPPLPEAQAFMLGAEVVHTADQVHPFLQRPLLTDQRPAAPHQRRQAGAERRVEPLDVRRVDLPARLRLAQLLLDLFLAAPDHAAEDPLEQAAAVPLDHLPQPHAAGQPV